MRRSLALALVLCASVASIASAKTKNGITPTKPEGGTVLASGHGLTYKGKVSGKGQVFIHVAKTKKRDADGVINGISGSGVDVLKAKRKGGRFTAKAPDYSFPSYYLVKPGTYYWQAFRIECTGSSDCSQEGPIVKFKVR